MRKFLVLLISITLVLAFTVPASALHKTAETEYQPGVVTKEGVQIGLSGQIRNRYEYRHNTSLSDDGQSERSGWNNRVRLTAKARVTPNTWGVLQLESGDSHTNDSVTWAQTSKGSGASGSSLPSVGNKKLSQVWIRQAFVAHQMHITGDPNVHQGIKVGHMLLALGNGLFFDHSHFGDDAVILWSDIGMGEVSFNFIKFEEGNQGLSDDATAYALAVEYPMDTFNFSGDVTYVDAQTPEIHLWNLGLRGDASFGAVKVMADVELQTGEDDINNIDYEGWAFLVNASTTFGAINAKAEFAYGSGDDPATADREDFQSSVPTYELYSFIYGVRSVGATGSTGNGWTNTWYAKLKASTDINPETRVQGEVFYLGADEDVALASATSADSDLGWEIDGKIEHDLDKNLLLYVEGGIFFPGDAYGDADSAYAIRPGLIFKF